MIINEATRKNLLRKSHFIDKVQEIDGVPLFSWIDMNITELCNRTCVFCPRSTVYPNRNLHMAPELAEKIATELDQLNYAGSIVLCGFSEPLLHPDHLKIISILKDTHLEIVTSGDKLNLKSIKELWQAGINYFVVSMYDGPHQKDKFRDLFQQAGLDENDYILRDRWHNSADEFGLKLTNRAGSVQVGDQPVVDINSPCYYTAYSMMMDWNGDILLCVQDWSKKFIAGNLYKESLWDIWRSPMLTSFRKRLMNSDRHMPPCNKCNADGTLHGFNHKDYWSKIYKVT